MSNPFSNKTKAATDPASKADVLNRMMRRDWDGDLQSLFAEGADFERLATNAVRIKARKTGKVFDFMVRIPKSDEARAKAKEAWLMRQGSDGGQKVSANRDKRPKAKASKSAKQGGEQVAAH